MKKFSFFVRWRAILTCELVTFGIGTHLLLLLGYLASPGANAQTACLGELMNSMRDTADQARTATIIQTLTDFLYTNNSALHPLVATPNSKIPKSGVIKISRELSKSQFSAKAAVVLGALQEAEKINRSSDLAGSSIASFAGSAKKTVSEQPRHR